MITQHLNLYGSHRGTTLLNISVKNTTRTAMEYLLILLAAATAALISVEGKIPSYIKRCGRHDPNLDGCIKHSAEDLRKYLVKGIPELAVPTLDPLRFDLVTLALGPGLESELQNLELKGLERFTLEKVKADLAKDTFLFHIAIPEVIVRGTYKIDAALAGIPLKGEGPLHFVTKSVIGIGTLYGKKVARGEKVYYYFRQMDFKLNLTNYHMKLDNLFGGNSTIGEVTNKLLNDEKTEVLASLLPGLEKAIVEKALLVANNICKHFTWDELFPITGN